MQGRKAISLILTVVMLMALLPVFTAPVYAAGETESVTQPKITVVGSTIAAADGTEDNDFFELNLKIEPGTAGFSTAGVVLKYNRNVILPVDWSGNDIEVPIGENWEEEKIAVIPAMGPAELSGKVALAQNPAADSAWGYLYLSAEAPLPITNASAIEKAVTVRFKYVDKTLVDPPASASPAPTATPEPTAEPVAPADEPDPGESPDPDESPEPTASPGTTQIPTSKKDILQNFLDGSIVSVAPNLVAERSPAGKIVWYKADYSDTNEYFYEEPDTPSTFALTSEPTLSLAAPPDLGLVQNGSSASTGGGGGVDLSSVRTALCYDWDNTFLGAVTVAEGDAAKDANAASVEAFAKTLYKDADTKYTTDIETNEDRYADDPNFPLTYKKSYNFSGWMETTAANLESTHSSFEDKDAIKAVLKDFTTENLTFTNGVTYLKAAYLGNELLDTFDGSGGAESGTRSYYTFSDYSYERIDAVNFSTRLVVTRKNADGIGVTRLREPVLKVEMAIGANSVITVVKMTGQDHQVLEIIAPKGADSYKINIADNATGRSFVIEAPSSIVTNVTPVDSADPSKGYIPEGTYVYINKMAASATETFLSGVAFGTWTTSINIAYFQDMHLYDEIKSQDTTNKADVYQTNVAKNKIMLYKVALGDVDLERQDLIDAIAMQTSTHLTNAATYAYMKPKIEAVQAKRTALGRDLTISELEAFIQSDFN